MCKRGTLENVAVRISADLSCTGKIYMKIMKIDACIAPIVDALQKGGINMRGSCCGHGKSDASIELQDGRQIIIKGQKPKE